jgi:hypothetical protein
MKSSSVAWSVRLLVVAGLGVVAGVVLFNGPSIRQDVAYHQFADQRPWLGVPHFANVVSNLPFLVVGILGLWVLAKKAVFLDPVERWPYFWFFAGIGLTAFGSAYYHWHPNNERLFWDRLPMAVAFMGLFSAVLSERLGPRVGVALLPWLLVAGVASSVYWNWTDDLRPYYLVQFYPMAAIPLLLLLFPPRYTGTGYLFLALAFYALAKVCEMRWDLMLFERTGVSGHTFKHLLAAMGAYWIAQMVWKRRALTRPVAVEALRTPSSAAGSRGPAADA